MKICLDIREIIELTFQCRPLINGQQDEHGLSLGDEANLIKVANSHSSMGIRCFQKVVLNLAE